MNPFSWARAQTVAEAAAAASATVANAMTAAPAAIGRGDAAIVMAGGIDVVDLLKEELLAPQRVVSLREAAGLDRIAEEPGGGLRIGSMVTLTRVAEHPLVRRLYPALADSIRNSASPQIRNIATLGGNLLQRPRCWYFRAQEFRCLRKGGGHCYAIAGENRYHAIFSNRACAIVHPSTAATMLVALGATVELAGADGAMRTVPLEDFFVSPDIDLQRENDLRPHEILTAVRLPSLPAGARMAQRRQGEKDSFDWPLAEVAVVLDLSPAGNCRRASIVLGAAAPVPHRARSTEAALTGRRVDDALAREAARAAREGATPLSQNAYKLALFETLVQRTILDAAGQG